MPVRFVLRSACLLSAGLTLLSGTARAQRLAGVTLQIVPVEGSTDSVLQLEPGQRAPLELRAVDRRGGVVDLSSTPIEWRSTEPLQVKGDGSRAVVAASAAGEATITASALRQTVTLRALVASPKLVPSQPVTTALAPAKLALPVTDRAMRAAPAGAGTSSPPPPPPAAKITYFSPREGRAGDRVIIGGTGFSNPNPGVDFANGTNVAANQVVDGPGTLINAYVPPGDVTGKVRVSGVLTDFEFIELASFDPPSSPTAFVAPDAELFITGKAMQNVTAVHIGFSEAPIISKSYTRITFKLPPNLQQVQSATYIGRASLTYRVADGGTRPAWAGPDMTIQVTPAITGFLPDSGAACGSALVRGRALINDPSPGGGTTNATVTMASASGAPVTSPYASGSNSQISFYVPKGAVTGPVTVKGYNNQRVTSSMPFRIVAPMPTATLQSNWPLRVGEEARYIGRLAEVTKVTFTGGVEVTQGLEALEIGNSGSCQDVLKLVVPAGAQTGPVTFTNAAGTATSSITISAAP